MQTFGLSSDGLECCSNTAGWVCSHVADERGEKEEKDESVNKLLCQPFALIYCCHLVENVKWVLPGRLNRILQE